MCSVPIAGLGRRAALPRACLSLPDNTGPEVTSYHSTVVVNLLFSKIPTYNYAPDHQLRPGLILITLRSFSSARFQRTETAKFRKYDGLGTEMVRHRCLDWVDIIVTSNRYQHSATPADPFKFLINKFR